MCFFTAGEMETETNSGDGELRFCIACDKMVPLECFKTKNWQYRCAVHARSKLRNHLLAKSLKRVYVSLRSRALQDANLLGNGQMRFPEDQVMSMLNANKSANHKTHCFMPMDPEKPLRVSAHKADNNAAIVTNAQRRFVLANWKDTHGDVAKYRRDMQHVAG